jgi:uncharacterized phage protein (TIGR02218 family)
MTPSAIERGSEGDASAMAATGALVSGAIREGDLLAGRWDGAKVACFAVDWTDVARRVALGGGTIGAVETRDGGFTAELVGPAAGLERPVSEETAPSCRARLGDARCRVAMAARVTIARVVAGEDDAVTIDVDEPVANGWGGGRLRWFGGANTGLEDAIAMSAGAVLSLRAPPRFTPRPGDLVEVTQGCDKTIATCAGRFDNAVNFRGEPYLPGIDLLTRYPGA